MSGSQITDVDIVAHACSVRCVVIVAKDIQMIQPADGNL